MMSAIMSTQIVSYRTDGEMNDIVGCRDVSQRLSPSASTLHTTLMADASEKATMLSCSAKYLLSVIGTERDTGRRRKWPARWGNDLPSGPTILDPCEGAEYESSWISD